MQTIARSSFTTVKTEGGLLPADLLQRVADGRGVDGLRPEDYHLLPTERLNEAINRAWNRCLGAWQAFDDQRTQLAATDTGTTLTRERWLLVLFQELGYGRLSAARGVEVDPEYMVMPYFAVLKNDLIGYPTWRWILCFKKVTSPTNERTLIATVLPKCAANDSIHLVLGKEQAVPIASQVGLIGEIAGFALDYVVRQKLGGVNLNFYIFEQLPVHSPVTYTRPCPWSDVPSASVSTNLSLAAWLLPRVLELTYTAWDLQLFAQDCGYDGPPFRWDEERSFLLRCELDAAYFHLYGIEYGIERDDVAYILDTFPIVKRKDIAAHGEYRTQRVILEIYDAMASGVPYQTRLDPPPADPRVAHGGKE